VVACEQGVDIDRERIRKKRGGAHAGTNGWRGIDGQIGKDYHRMRLGMGHQGDKKSGHGDVLGDFAKTEAELVGKLIDAVAECAPCLGSRKFDAFMSQTAMRLNPPRPKPEKPTGRVANQNIGQES